MTSPSPTGVTFEQAAGLLAAHLTGYELPEPVTVTVLTHRVGHTEVEAQLHSGHTVAEVAGQLLTWADTLTTCTVQAWRTPHGDQVHLSIASTLTGPTGAVDLDIYGAAAHDPDLFTDLAPGERRIAPVDELRRWAANASDAAGGGGVA